MKKNKTSMKNTKKSKVKNGKPFQIVNYGKFYFIALLICTTVITVPLGLVWKQVYITRLSLKYDSLKAKTMVLNKEMVALNLEIKQLSNTERIENIARNSLDLNYPTSQEIIIVRSEKKKNKRLMLRSPFWALLKKSIELEKG